MHIKRSALGLKLGNSKIAFSIGVKADENSAIEADAMAKAVNPPLGQVRISVKFYEFIPQFWMI